MFVVMRGPFVPMGPFGDLDEHFRADRVEVGDVLGLDALLAFAVAAALLGVALDLLEAGVEGFGNGVPEVEEGVFLETNVDEHRVQPGLDVADDAFVDRADDALVVFSLHGVFLERAVLEEGDARLEFLTVDDDLDSFVELFGSEQFAESGEHDVLKGWLKGGKGTAYRRMKGAPGVWSGDGESHRFFFSHWKGRNFGAGVELSWPTRPRESVFSLMVGCARPLRGRKLRS